MQTDLLLRRLSLLVLGLGLVTGVLIGTLILVAHDLIYHPRDYLPSYQRLFSPGMVELRFKTEAGWQSAFYVPPHKVSALPEHIWVAFCGNGSLALDWLPLTARIKDPGIAFLLIDYPGYGRSEGRASIAHNRAAGNGAVTALAARLGVHESDLEPRLDTIGHSIGAAAALDFATHHQVSTIVLLAPFTTLREEAATFVGGPLSHLFLDNYDNRAALRQLARRRPPPRVFIYHGEQDGLISPRMGRELAREFPAFVIFRGVPNATHDDVGAVAGDDILAIMNGNTSPPR